MFFSSVHSLHTHIHTHTYMDPWKNTYMGQFNYFLAPLFSISLYVCVCMCVYLQGLNAHNIAFMPLLDAHKPFIFLCVCVIKGGGRVELLSPSRMKI